MAISVRTPGPSALLAPLAQAEESALRQCLVNAVAQLIADQRCGCRERNCPALRHARPDAVLFTDDVLAILDGLGIALARTRGSGDLDHLGEPDPRRR